MPELSVPILVFVCLLACCAFMAGVWLWGQKIKNASVVDIFWALNFVVIAAILYCFAAGFETRKLMICAMVALAGFRLGRHLFIRVAGHINEEEGRYRQLRQDWSPNADRKFFWFFQMQAVSNVLLAIPFFIISSNSSAQIEVIEYTGAIIWLIGYAGEAIADGQLRAFKQDATNKGKVCQYGLWNYSRHPNYFFEWLMWVGYFVFALGSPYGWLAMISPAIILFLLLKVTGIPATEEQAIRSKGDLYRAYQKSTSVFVPWFKKNEPSLNGEALMDAKTKNIHNLPRLGKL